MNEQPKTITIQEIPLSHKILFMGIILLGIVLGVELFLHWYIPANLAPNPSAIFTLDPMLGWSIEPNQTLCYIGGDGKICLKRSNQYGTLGPHFTSPKPDRTFRAIVVGDSHLHSPISESKTFSAALQRMLNKETEEQNDNLEVEVINAAVGGYSPYQQILRVLALHPIVEPDAIIWGFYSGNDIANCEFSDGPFIDDEFQGWLSPLPYDKKTRLFNNPADPHARGIFGFLQSRLRLFDLIDYTWTTLRNRSTWDVRDEGFYESMQRGPLRQVPVERIKEIMPDMRSYLAWTSWFSQGGSQRLYYRLHPDRIETAYRKVRALIAALSLLQHRTGTQVYMVYLPSFLESPDEQQPPYPAFEAVIDTGKVHSLERDLAGRCQTWCDSAGIIYLDGLTVLRDSVGDKLWYDRTAHLTAQGQKLLARAIQKRILKGGKPETAMATPLEWINSLTEEERRFAENPWPSHPRWSQIQDNSPSRAPITLDAICALFSPGPWRVGMIWRARTYAQGKVFLVFWQKDEQGKPKRIARFPAELDPLRDQTTIWSRQDWLTIQPIPNLPDQVSVEAENRQPLSKKYEIPWRERD